MAQVTPNVLLTATHTPAAPLTLTANTATFYIIKNRSADTPVIARANTGDWVRIRPTAEAMLQDSGAEITQLQLYIHDSPRFASRDGVVSHAQSAQVEITTH